MILAAFVLLLLLDQLIVKNRANPCQFGKNGLIRLFENKFRCSLEVSETQLFLLLSECNDQKVYYYDHLIKDEARTNFFRIRMLEKSIFQLTVI